MDVMSFVIAFVVGGFLCVLAQLTVDLTSHNVSPGHVMVLFVALGAVASALGLYKPLAEFAGAGATIPLTGFGHALVQGALQEATVTGPPGLLTGGLRATALGITAAVLLGYVMAVIFTPKG